MKRYIIFLLGLLLFLPSCHSASPQYITSNTPNDNTSKPLESTVDAVSTELSEFAEYTKVFGEGSLQYALTGISFDEITENDKSTITSVMRALDGSASFTDDAITITHNGQSAVFYSDGTTVLIDADGNKGGNRWIESPLSTMLTPVKNCELVMCLAKQDTFAVKYKCDNKAVYEEYRAELNGWTALSQSDMLCTAERTDEQLGHCELTVSFSDNTLTILIQVTQNPA